MWCPFYFLPPLPLKRLRVRHCTRLHTVRNVHFKLIFNNFSKTVTCGFFLLAVDEAALVNCTLSLSSISTFKSDHTFLICIMQRANVYMSKSVGFYIKSHDADELINVPSYSISQAWRTAHYSLMTKSRLFKRETCSGSQGGVCAVWHTTSVLSPSLCVLYSIFMQAGVLWEEPELAVDSERSWSSGNRDPVDAICPIIFISFGQRRVPTSRHGKQTKTTPPYKVCVFKFDSDGGGIRRWSVSF